MKKLVPESIEETLQLKGGPIMNEAAMGDWLNKAKNLIKGVFKKVGNFFVGFYKDKPVPAIAPVNAGVFCKDKNPKFLQYIPNDEDVAMEPGLAGMKSGDHILKRVKASYLAQAAKNRANHKLARLGESKKYAYMAAKRLNEEQVKLAYSGTDKVRNVGTDFLVKILTMQIRNPKLMPPCIWGAIGIGKTSITKAVIKTMGPGYRLIDVQTSKMAPDDWSLPSIYKVIGEAGTESVEARDIPKNWLPVYEPSDDAEEDSRRNSIANWGEGGIIFLDEISRAISEVQNTCLKLVDERIIGDRKLGSKWAVVAASNRRTDDPEGQVEMGSALANRFKHWNFVPSVDEWIEWGRGAKIDDRILTFVDFNRDHFYLFDNEVKVNTSPRTWEALSKMLQECMNCNDLVFSRADMENIMAGIIHSSTVEAFNAFLILLESFKPKEILMIFSDPDKAPKPKAKGSGFDILQANALIGAVCSQSKDKKLTAQELENYVSYWAKLGDASLAAKALWLIVETHPYIHQETGDIKGKEKYKPAMDIFRKAFGNVKFGKREDVMGT